MPFLAADRKDTGMAIGGMILTAALSRLKTLPVWRYRGRKPPSSHAIVVTLLRN
jgi:hypothetical protein